MRTEPACSRNGPIFLRPDTFGNHQATRKRCMRVTNVLLLSAGLAVGAFGQSAPVLELGGQYQMLRVGSGNGLPAFTANGGTGSVQVNFLDQIAGVLEVGMVHNGDIQGLQLNSNWLSYLVGPRVSLRKPVQEGDSCA